MPWTERDKPTPFDKQPIPGLFYLDGKQVEVPAKQAWMDGYKRPMIAFPSGEEFLLDVNSDTGEPEVHLFGKMSLPLQGGFEQAHQQASEIAARAGYSIDKFDERHLALLGKHVWERYLVSYSPEGEIEDIEAIPALHPGPVNESGRGASLQYDLFTGELMDTRSPKQKRRDKERTQPRQMEMFSNRQVLQFGVKARPTLPLINSYGLPPGMELQIQDPRSEEEKELDGMKAAQAQTYHLFNELPVKPDPHPKVKKFPSGLRAPLVEVEDEGIQVEAQLAEGLAIRYWSTRDEAYEHARDTFHRKGFTTYPLGDSQLEIWKPDQSGYFLVTYSSMAMVENVEWVSSYISDCKT